jgi:hypothetical protein
MRSSIETMEQLKPVGGEEVKVNSSFPLSCTAAFAKMPV